jgi:hypothetical protein
MQEWARFKHIIGAMFFAFLLSASFAGQLIAQEELCDIEAVKKELGDNYPQQYMDLIFTGSPPFDRLYEVEYTDWYWKKLRLGDLQPALVIGNPESYAGIRLQGLGAGQLFPRIQGPAQESIERTSATARRRAWVSLYKNPYSEEELDSFINGIWGDALQHPLFKIRFVTIFEDEKSKEEQRKGLFERLKFQVPNLQTHFFTPISGCRIERRSEKFYIRQTLVYIANELTQESKARCRIVGMLTHLGLSNASPIIDKLPLSRNEDGKYQGVFDKPFKVIYPDASYKEPLPPGSSMCVVAKHIANHKYKNIKGPFHAD